MKKTTILLYGLICYTLFNAVFLYMIGFVGDFYVPNSLDSAPTAPTLLALAINLGLVVLFGLQHSVMARPAFKKAWTKIIPEAAERSTYVLATCIALGAMMVFWQPMGGVVWSLDNTVITTLLYGVFFAGWGLVFLSTCLINHFDLFGLRQVWLNFCGVEYTPVKFVEPRLYQVVRHPLYLGLLMAFWAAPHMTVTHLVFALGTTAYILVGANLEERDLAEAHPQYRDYKRRVPMLVPFLKRRGRGGALDLSSENL